MDTYLLVKCMENPMFTMFEGLILEQRPGAQIIDPESLPLDMKPELLEFVLIT